MALQTGNTGQTLEKNHSTMARSLSHCFILFTVTAPLTKTVLQIQKLIREASSAPHYFDHCHTVMWFHLHYKQALMKNKGNESSYQTGNVDNLPHAFTFQLLSRCHYTEHLLPLHTCISIRRSEPHTAALIMTLVIKL